MLGLNRRLLIVVVFLLMLVLVSCGGNETLNEDGDLDTESAIETEVEEETIIDGDMNSDGDDIDGDMDYEEEIELDLEDDSEYEQTEQVDRAEDEEDGEPEQAEAYDGPNICPEAVISLGSHGPPVTSTVKSITESSIVAFYANSSRDRYGSIESFSWSLLSIPPTSSAEIGSATDSDMVAIFFDIAGDYQLELEVTDNDGCSDSQIIDIEVQNNQGVHIILDFDPGWDSFDSNNMVDMDLFLTGPNGSKCHSGSINSSNKFSFICGSEATMSIVTNGAGESGTREGIVVFNMVDGLWTFGVTFVENCQSWTDHLTRPFCAARLSTTTFEITIYDPNSLVATDPLFPVIQGNIDFGQTKSWSMTRVNGVISPPVAIP